MVHIWIHIEIIHETLEMAISCHVSPQMRIGLIGGRQVNTHLCATTQNAHILQSFHACMKSCKYIHKMGHDSKVWHGSCVVVVPKLTRGKKLRWSNSNIYICCHTFLKGSFLKHWYGMSAIFPSYIEKWWTIHDFRLPFLNHLWLDFKFRSKSWGGGRGQDRVSLAWFASFLGSHKFRVASQGFFSKFFDT
jgi:heme A synthase